ncbi:hypothetical protein [Microbacterium sp. K2]|uniref:hypothetical protein n=1 Tax=Microbacterium sp. K2 TaxID=3391827 RepID=UPI003ED907A5
MPVKAPTVGPGSFTIGSEAALTNFSSQIRGAKLVPNVTKGDPIDVLSGEQAPGDRTEENTIVVTLQSDFGHADSNTEWLWAHRGEQHPFEYVPNNTLDRKITGTLVVEAIEIGGDVKTKPSAEVTFDLVGPPVFEARV